MWLSFQSAGFFPVSDHGNLPSIITGIIKLHYIAKKALFVKTLQSQRKLLLHVWTAMHALPTADNIRDETLFQFIQRAICDPARIILFRKLRQKLMNPALTDTVFDDSIVDFFSAGNSRAKAIKIKFVADRAIAVRLREVLWRESRFCQPGVVSRFCQSPTGRLRF